MSTDRALQAVAYIDPEDFGRLKSEGLIRPFLWRDPVESKNELALYPASVVQDLQRQLAEARADADEPDAPQCSSLCHPDEPCSIAEDGQCAVRNAPVPQLPEPFLRFRGWRADMKGASGDYYTADQMRAYAAAYAAHWRQRADDYRDDALRLHKDKCDALDKLYAADAREAVLRREIERLLGALADISDSKDMTLALARRKANRIYHEVRAALEAAEGR